MATKDQPEEPSSPKSNAGDQETGAAGILMSLLTEPPHKKVQSRQAPPMAVTPKTPESPTPSEQNDASVGNTASPSKGSPPTSQTSHSVLLQLLQEKKASLGKTNSTAALMQDATETSTSGADSDPKPIVITPANGCNGHNNNAEAEATSEAKTDETPRKHVGSTLCKICQCGFWDPEKYIEHMQIQHGQTVDDQVSSSVDTEKKTSMSQVSASEKPRKTPPPPSTMSYADDTGPRRSKRKRTPARTKYYDKDFQEDPGEDSDTMQPKILCVEGNISGSESSHSHSTHDPHSVYIDNDLIDMPPDVDWKMRPKQVSSANKEPSIHSGDEASSISVKSTKSRQNLVEEIVNYRCSQCFLYFNSRDETRQHLRDEHNISPVNSPTQASKSPHGQPTQSCASCGSFSDSQKISPSKQCVVCGKCEAPGTKGFINIFRARTWSSRHHQLAHRLSQAFGCKFSVATCKSRNICLPCVQKLESIEKASMQLRQMVKSLKRTNLVSSVENLNLKGSKKRMLKSVSAAVRKDKSPEEEAASTSNSESTATGREPIPIHSAPLVRELLAAPEVLLPQSQFSELLGALGNHKGIVDATSLGIIQPHSASFRPEFRPPSRSSTGSKQKVPEKRGAQKHSRNLATVQHDDVAFDEFVKELRAQQPGQDGGAYPMLAESGRILAEVRVKEEPTDHYEESASKSYSQPETVRVVSGSDSGSGFEELSTVFEDLNSLYTKMQIDSSSGQTEYACSLCNNSFYSEAAIQLHVKCHMLGSKDLQCFLCGYHNNLLPSQWRIMKRHLETEHNFPETYFHRFPCPVRGCAELFKCQKDMLVHVSKVHRTPVRLAREHALADVGLFNFPCHLCGTLLQSEAALQIHVLCHNSSPKHYQCCFCGYSHSSQPGSWRIMRGHLTKEHIDKELAPDIFSYHECPYYACRLKFCSKKAQIVHRACHDETKDGEFFCFQCHFSVPSIPYLWEKVRDHIIAKHPEAVGENFRCTCKARFDSFKAFLQHMNDVQPGSSRR